MRLHVQMLNQSAYKLSILNHFVLFRLLQVLGTYGFRGYFEKKPHFIESIPFAIKSLKELLHQGIPEYPYLTEVLLTMCELYEKNPVVMETTAAYTVTPISPITAAVAHSDVDRTGVPFSSPSDSSETPSSGALEVTVMSFAFPRGLPEDHTGNGGGFVFDCRAVHNPGRYEPYKKLTGMDLPVQQFLEEDGEIVTLLEHARALAEASVVRYLERGFTSLMVCFGCTGGQHRSVYAAERMAEYLHSNFGVKVHLVHREQNIEQYYGRK